MDQTVDIPLEGELNCWSRGFDLPDLLLTVCKTGKTGLLRFVSAEAEKTLFLREGEVIFAKSSSEDDRLGEYLLREGKISLQDLSKLTHLVKPGKRLGTILVENELLGPKELVQAVIGQVRAIVLSLFRWTEAWYGFDEQELPSKETITLDMPTSQLILDGVKHIESWRRITQGLGDMSSVYRRVPGNEDVLRGLNVDAATLEVLAHLSRPKSVAEACADSELGDLEVCRMMWVFRSFGWIEKVDGAEAQILSQAPDAEAEVVPAEEEAPTPAAVDALPQAPELPAPPSPDETSFEIVEGEVLELPEEGEIPAQSTPMEATPITMGTVDETASSRVSELSPVGPPVSASPADVNESPIVEPLPIESETEIDLGDPFPSTEPEPPIDSEPPSSSSGFDPEIDLGTPPNPLEPDPTIEEPPVFTGLEGSSTETPDSVPEVVSESEVGTEQDQPRLEDNESKPLGEVKEGSKKQAVVETDDMDLEGLGMVLGNDGKE